MKRRALLLLAVVTLTTASVSAGVASARVESVHKTVTIHIEDNSFDPAALDIAEGTTVRWINDGRNTHNVTPNRGRNFGSDNLKPGRSYVHTFPDAGTFAYYCEYHGDKGGVDMSGVIVVK